jgi:hypothetical protein
VMLVTDELYLVTRPDPSEINSEPPRRRHILG